MHISHHARRILGLDQIVWLVANHNPFKPDQRSFAERYDSACGYAAAWLQVSDFEYRHQTRTSFDSLRAWQEAHASARAVLLMGADAFCALGDWHRAHDILHLMPIAIAPRRGYDARHSPLAARWRDYILPSRRIRCLAASQAPALGFLSMPSLDISSTQRRENNN